MKCIDDALLYENSIRDNYFSTWDYLQLCSDNGITANEKKFQFCQDNVLFAGLQITATGIKPAESILSAIKDFASPKDLSSARSWFGLVNQIAWAYSNGKAMQPFRDLVKQSTKFHWDETLENLFQESKKILIEQSIEGIRTFDTTRNTCLQTDWSKDGIGYLLLQQHCGCPESPKGPLCCKDGWKLVFAGSRFTRGAELNYSPTEGEALGIVWGLEHAKMFVLGCEKLTISTDHKPLLGLFNDRDLSSISNTRLLNLKQRTMPFKFKMSYNPGKWHRGPDAVSRNPTSVHAILGQEQEDDSTACSIEDGVEAHLQYVMSIMETGTTVQISDIAQNVGDEYKLVSQTIAAGFPKTRNETDPMIRDYWSVKDRLSLQGNLLLMDDRLVIPRKLRPRILNGLHSAHQGTTSMLNRARQCVYWPGIDAAVRNRRLNCHSCNELSPSQVKEPIMLSPAPSYPFQMICSDYFSIGQHSYLSTVDRFTGWIIVHHFPGQATSRELISTCRSLFQVYGAPEEIATDGGPQFIAHQFQTFLSEWGVRHRKSSAHYPQSNGRAELAVKAAKRIICDNVSTNGSLDNDRAAKAIMQHRNTPIPEVGLSPAQVLLHRQLRDHIPANPKHYEPHPEWVISASDREKAFAKRNADIASRYNSVSHHLQVLEARTAVLIQEGRKWNRSGMIVEVLPNRQYRIRMDGSGRIVLRNRRYIRPMPTDRHAEVTGGRPEVPIQGLPTRSGGRADDLRVTGSVIADGRRVPSARQLPGESGTDANRLVKPPGGGSSPGQPGLGQEPTGVEFFPEDPVGSDGPAPDSEETEEEANSGPTPQPGQTEVKRVPKALRDLADHNRKGRKEDDGHEGRRRLRR